MSIQHMIAAVRALIEGALLDDDAELAHQWSLVLWHLEME